MKTTQNATYSNSAFCEPILGNTLLETFDAKVKSWSEYENVKDIWLREWAGKEVLKLVRQTLAGRFRPPIASGNKRIDPVVWGSGNGNAVEIRLRDDAIDRDIERAIQPILLKHLFQFLDSNADADLAQDFGRIRECLID